LTDAQIIYAVPLHAILLESVGALQVHDYFSNKGR
jgi:hypothetical protein